ncbi:hypothetical protein [Histidinibacterium aquaticum]|uniref:hypothetical protein n=1 Tax=Histidinibacterium aquaticum TaxID=2613962 RepID=UPI00168A637A|nr:hypothetical protein [Histidinibacterium aquaticum]
MARVIERFWDDEMGSAVVDRAILAAGIFMLGSALAAAVLPAPADLAAQDQPATLAQDV